MIHDQEQELERRYMIDDRERKRKRDSILMDVIFAYGWGN